jgi:glycosyltransferase involved in cell wall biosynthesis
VKKEIFVGGATVSAVRLGKALHALGDAVFVLSSAPRGKPSKIYKFDSGVIVNKRIPGRYNSLPHKLLFSLTFLLGLLSLCSRNRIHVISSHSGNVLLSTIPSIIGRLLRIPAVHTQYCSIDPKQQGSFRHTLTRLSLKLPTRFVAISRNVRQSLVKAGLSVKRVDLIPPVIPRFEKKSNLHFGYRKLLCLKRDDFVVVFVGSLKKNKGIDVLLEAFRPLVSEGYRLKLVITTELAHNAFIERKQALLEYVVKHDLVNTVLWLGIVDDVHALLSEADIAVVPFLNLEGISDYPLVALEALSVGTPVIASAVGGIHEILRNKETGILIPPGDVEALRKTLKSIVTNKKLMCRLQDNVRSYPFLCYDSDVVGRKYRELFLQEVNKIG